nr:PucR family transcriptional regulator [Deinobacterium chartae]
MPTLREILALPAFAGVEVRCAPGDGFEVPVTWVHVCEVLDAHRFLSGGELLLTTGLELSRAAPAAHADYARSLAEAGAAGLVLELVQGLREVPPEVLRSARMCGLPVLVFRHEVRFADLTRAAHARILQPHTRPHGAAGLGPVLDALAETGRSHAFLQAQLGPLLSLPARTRATLLGTLGALLHTQFNMAEASRLLGVRRQTVYYRLEQLRGMLGDLNDSRRRLGLLLALELAREGGTEPLGLDTVSLVPAFGRDLP